MRTSRSASLYSFIARLCQSGILWKEDLRLIARFWSQIEHLATLRSDDPECDASGRELTKTARSICDIAMRRRTEALQCRIPDSMQVMWNPTTSGLQYSNLSRVAVVELRSGLAAEFAALLERMMLQAAGKKPPERGAVISRLAGFCSAMVAFADMGDATRRKTAIQEAAKLSQTLIVLGTPWDEYGKLLPFLLWSAPSESLSDAALRQIARAICPTARKILPQAAQVAAA